MLKKIYNELSFDIVIDTVDPIIIKSGKASLSGPDDNPVKTWRRGKEEAEPFIPGSSLKGVFRSHLEKIIRTYNEKIVCLPYMSVADARVNNDGYNIFCGNKFQQRMKDKEWGANKSPSTELVYTESCPICKLFGSTFFKGRIAISDAYLVEDSEAVLEERDGVAIDRFTGGAASRALFQVEVVSKASFKTKVVVNNFECWQLGMLAIIMNDLEDELIQVGAGTSRGFGRIRGTIDNVTVSLFRQLPNNNQIWGLGHCLNDNTYSTSPDDFLALNNMPAAQIIGIRKKYEFKDEALTELKTAAIDYLDRKVPTWSLPETMRFDNTQRRN